MLRKYAFVAVLVALCAGVTLPVKAEELDNGMKDRQGFFLGFGLGGGYLRLQDDSSSNHGVFLGNFHIGGGLSESLLLMYDSSMAITQSNGITLTVHNGSFAAQWFPVEEYDFYIRPGIGFTMSTASTSAAGVTVSANSDMSIGADFASGYEFRFGKRFALSPELVYHFSDIRGGGGNAQGHSLGAQALCRWYF